MARPTKPGLDYFRHDIGLMSDPKLITPRRKYGYLAIVVYLQLLVMVYRDKGYYLEYNDETRDGVIWAIKSEVLQGKYDPDPTTIEDVINCLAACRLFSHDLFQRGFITSRRIQEHYYFATTGRTNPDVKWELWLFGEQEMREISSRSVLLQKFISREENMGFASEKPTFHKHESTHSKVEDKKEKNIKENDSISTLASGGRLENILEVKLNRSNLSAIQKMQRIGMTDDVLLDTAEYARQNARGDRAAYFMTVLRERFDEGILTEEDLKRIFRKKAVAAASRDDPTRPLEQWEQDWLEEIERRKRRDKEASS